MKTIDYLKQIEHMDARINADIENLAQLEAMATKTTPVMGGEHVQSSGSQQKMEDCVVKIVSLKEQINADIDRFIDIKKEAREYLHRCDSECITLLHKRYFMFETWERIAVEMGYTYQWVSGGLHRKALHQYQKAMEGEPHESSDD